MEESGEQGLARRPEFSEEQLAWIEQALRPLCCHVSGEHAPDHWYRRGRVCEIQKRNAYDAFRSRMDLAPVRAEECMAASGCYWCEEIEKTHHAQALRAAQRLGTTVGQYPATHCLANGIDDAHQGAVWLRALQRHLQSEGWICITEAAEEADETPKLSDRWPGLETAAARANQRYAVLVGPQRWEAMLEQLDEREVYALRHRLSDARGVHLVAMRRRKRHGSAGAVHDDAVARLESIMEGITAGYG